MSREPVSNAKTKEAQDYIKEKLRQAILKHGPGSFYSTHEILGQITEEYHELIDAIRDNNKQETIDELADIAVICLHGIASLKSKG